jgi:hypothetical protein
MGFCQRHEDALRLNDVNINVAASTLSKESSLVAMLLLTYCFEALLLGLKCNILVLMRLSRLRSPKVVVDFQRY